MLKHTQCTAICQALNAFIAMGWLRFWRSLYRLIHALRLEVEIDDKCMSNLGIPILITRHPAIIRPSRVYFPIT